MSELPKGWERKRLGEVVGVSYGKGLRETDRSGTGEFPVVGSSGVLGSHSAALVDGSVIVVGRKGKVGAAYLTNGPSWPIDTTYYLSVYSDLDPRFLAYQINHLALDRLDSSTAVPSLRRPDLESVEVVFPRLGEQQRIVDVIEEQFSRLDAGVESLHRAKRSLARFRSATLKAAVEGRLTGSSTGLIEGLPSLWSWATPNQLAADEPHALAIGPFGSDLKVSDYRPSGVPLVFVRNIRNRQFSEIGAKYVSDEKAADLEAHSVLPGDLLITKMGDPPGDAAVYTGSQKAVITADCIKFRPGPDVDARYLDLAINSPCVRLQMLAITKGVAQLKVSLGRFRSEIRIPLPPLGEQQRIITEVDRQFSIIDAMGKAIDTVLARASSLRQSILSQAFSGGLTAA